MPKGWRFRSGWNNVAVLQRRVETPNYNMGPTMYHWRDATTEDLVDFMEANKC